MAVTRRLGQQLTSTLGAGKALTIAFAASSPPTNSFENLATYSSQGPTVDFRVKPDIVAPGTVTSARVGAGSANDCGLTTMAVRAAPDVLGPRLCSSLAALQQGLQRAEGRGTRLERALRAMAAEDSCDSNSCSKLGTAPPPRPTPPQQGTSMATPVTAGSALLVRQYFTDGFYPSGGRCGGLLWPLSSTSCVLLHGSRVVVCCYDACQCRRSSRWRVGCCAALPVPRCCNPRPCIPLARPPCHRRRQPSGRLHPLGRAAQGGAAGRGGQHCRV
jgi:hypothetical protein